MQLPYSEELNIEYLGRLFDNTSECYKFFWFDALITNVIDGKNEIDYTVLPTPREISQSCGMSIRFGLEDIYTIKEIIDQNQIEYKSMYRIFKEDGKKQVEEIN